MTTTTCGRICRDCSANSTAPDQAGDPRHLSEVERRHVQAVLHEEKGNKVQAARVLGISRRSLYRPIEKYHLE